MTKYMNDKEHLLDLVGQMKSEEAATWREYGHLAVASCFIGRTFILFRCQGQERRPELLTKIRIEGLKVDPETGVEIMLYDESTQDVQFISHEPQRLMNLERYQIFVSVPTRFEFRVDAFKKGRYVQKNISFPMLVKTRNKPTFMSKGNHYLLTTAKFRELYPNEEIIL